ncbi:MAG: PQQ-dependent dehydrogenase, methanol/ethanol family [Vicinamibacterales bacterium]
MRVRTNSKRLGSVQSSIRAAFAVLTLSGGIACGSHAFANDGGPSPRDPGAGIEAEDDGTNWPSYGRTYSEAHESPLTQIDSGNVGRLGLTSAVDLGDDPHGATVPIAVDGVVYVTVGQSKVHAVDARSGTVLWKHDPLVARRAGRKLRYAWGARGLAYWDGKVFVGTLDGRLIAIDARSGREVWSVVTTAPDDDRYITGAPRVYGGIVIIGHAGADVAATRGYVTAYDAATGAQRWRFYTVPGDPSQGFENEAMRVAAGTWNGEWWKKGGGGTVWNAITYDPEQDLIYLGTGNGAPYNQRLRSPGGGDNLYLASIVALDATTGAYRWHYQVTPGETWDFNDAMDITLATLTIAGQARKVLLHAPKNGFFYVIDRTTGKLISAEKFADKVTWADRIDPVTGRPVETASARQPTELVWPSTMGAHNWQPMAFNRRTGLVYIPTIEMPGQLDDRGIDPATWTPRRGEWNTGYSLPVGEVPANAGSSYLQAYDPVRQERVWKAPMPGAWPGGVLTTAGNLVFNGGPDGKLQAYAAHNGKPLWSFDAGLGITGAPIAFSIGGTQYIAVVAGWGGLGAAYFGPLSGFGWQSREKRNHLFIFALDGKAVPPGQAPPQQAQPVDDPSVMLDPGKVAEGGELFSRTCVACHGAGAYAAGLAPDLRASSVPLKPVLFRSIVHDGVLQERGMPQYAELTDAQLEALRQFIRDRARNHIQRNAIP